MRKLMTAGKDRHRSTEAAAFRVRMGTAGITATWGGGI